MSPRYLRTKLRRLGLPVPADVESAAREELRQLKRDIRARDRAWCQTHVDELAARLSIALEQTIADSPLPHGGLAGKTRLSALVTRAMQVWMKAGEGRPRLRADRLGAGQDSA